jgi:hypothetical protein
MVTETTGFSLLFDGIDHFYANHLPSAIILTILLLGIGVGIGKKAIPFLQDILGKGQVTVNVEHEEGRPERLCIPENCPDHKAEQQRSLRNELAIRELWDQYGKLREEIMGKLDKIAQGNQQILLALIDKGRIRARDLGGQ